MDSKRQQKYARLIQKDVGEILQQDVKSLFGNAFISVTTVRVSPDLSSAKIYLSFIMAPDKQKLLDEVNNQTKVIRKMLADRIRNQARIIPDIRFYLDDNVEYAAHIDKIFSRIEIPKGDENKDDKGSES